MANNNLLFEIGLEDLPSKNLNIFSDKIKINIEKNLKKNGINFSSIENFYTNIRLIFLIKNVDEKIIKEKKLIKGPPIDKCYENNKPTKTAMGFAKKYKVDLSELIKKEIDGKEYLFCVEPESTIYLDKIIAPLLEQSLNSVEEQKKMRWGDSSASFIRPIRWLLLILDDKHISGEIFRIDIKNYTYGNKNILNKKINIKNVEDYFDILTKENIEIRQKKRQEIILEEINTIALENKFENILDKDLVDELANMVEYPYLYLGTFPEKYLELPDEVLKYVIQDTQKYCLVYKDGKIINYFIGVSNVKINNNIIIGNQRVINPRLDDASFFISKDLASDIFSKKEFLKRLIFHKKLGSVFDKVERIKKLSSHINKKSYSDNHLKFIEIADICKLDLISNMVVEIPKLQGHIGSYYASELGLNDTVAEGIREHYAPRNPEDKIPSSVDAQIVSMADKLDTIVGIFLADEKPTGTRDPLGIRRATNGLLRILLETNYSINLTELVNISSKLIHNTCGVVGEDKNFESDCNLFFTEKLFYILKENYNFNDSVIQSVLNRGNDLSPYESLMRIKALNSILADPNYEGLFENAKRISNILKKSDKNLLYKFNKNLLRESSEKILYNAVIEIENDLELALSKNDYVNYLKNLNTLSSSIKIFFDNVMINVEDEDTKINRLSLLVLINNHYTNFANIAILSH